MGLKLHTNICLHIVQAQGLYFTLGLLKKAFDSSGCAIAYSDKEIG
jgi:hypothetical protein